MTKAAEPPKPPAKLETITLKAFIHCEGCRRKIRRIIRVLDGVEDVSVDSATGKVTVVGTADVKTILQRLQKYGKQAEVWPSSNAPAAPAKSAGGSTQPKPTSSNNNNNNPDSNTKKKKNNAGGESGGNSEAAAQGNESKKGGGKKEEVAQEVDKVEEKKPEKSKETKPEKSKEANASTEGGNANAAPQQNGGGGGGGGGGKKGKKGGNPGNNGGGGGGGGGTPEAPPPFAGAPDQPSMSAPPPSVTVSANKSLAPYDSVQTGYSSYNSVDYATHMFSDENANNCSIM